MTHCPICDAEAVLVHEERDVPVGARVARIKDELFRCPECGEAFYTPEQARLSFRRATDVVRAEDGVLTPTEIRDIRRRIGLNQKQLERILKVGPKTLTRWEKGTVPPSGTADTLLRVLGEFPDVVDAMARRHGIERRGAVPSRIVFAIPPAVSLPRGRSHSVVFRVDAPAGPPLQFGDLQSDLREDATAESPPIGGEAYNWTQAVFAGAGN